MNAPTLKDLLGRGYFPNELPPPFNSVSFGQFAESRGSSTLPFDTTTKGFKTSHPEIYNLARAGSFRRELAILNPIHFAELAQFIASNWQAIAQSTNSKLSLTLPTLTATGRAISRKFSLDVLPKRRAEVRSQGTFLLKAESLLMQCAQVEAGALSLVLASMLKYPADDPSLSRRRRSMLLQIVEMHAPQRHSSEVAWALWACVAMGIAIPNTAVRAALRINDSVCSLLLLHAKSNGLVKPSNELRSLRAELNNAALYGPRWLLAYEANLKGWFRFSQSNDYVAQDRNFRHLKTANVSFYDESKTVLPSTERLERVGVVDDYLSKIGPDYGGADENENFDFEGDDDSDR